MNKSKLPNFDVESLTDNTRPVAVYWLVLTLLTALILITGASISLQSQERHRTYRTLQELKRTHANLKRETTSDDRTADIQCHIAGGQIICG